MWRKEGNIYFDILLDRSRHSSILIIDVRSLRAADCDTDHYLVVAKVRERLAVSKQTTHSLRRMRWAGNVARMGEKRN
jgi:hypothetical protein